MTINVPRTTSTLRPRGSLEATVVSIIDPETGLLSVAPLSQPIFHSFDLQQTGIAPLNRILPEFNTARFS